MENNNEAEMKLVESGYKKIQIVKREIKSEPVLSVVDIFLSIFVVTPLVVASWRGLWGFMDFYGIYFPPLPTFVVGITIHVILALCQETLHDIIIESEKNWTLKLVSHFLRRFYTYIFLVITIFHWRGGWMLLDYYTAVQYTDKGVTKKENSQWLLIVGSVCFLALAFMRGLRNATAPPYGICLDKGSYVFKFPTMFKFNEDEHVFLYLCDCIFSVAVMGNVVIFFWRGLWVITDIILLPNDFVASTWTSLVLGLLLVGVVFRLQTFMKNLCSRLSGLAKLILADFYIMLSIISTVLYWRGVWNLLFIYFLPSDFKLSCALSHLIGLTFLLMLGCSNSMLVRGVYKDGKEPNGECVVFPCQYLRVILEQENADTDEYDDLSDKNRATMYRESA